MRFILALALLLAACSQQPAATQVGVSGKPDFSAQAAPVKKQTIRVIDGDTLVVDGETIRIQNIDAPELPPKAKCLSEAALAIQADKLLRETVQGPWPLVIDRSGKDRYGRTLAHVYITRPNADPSDIGDILHTAGVAASWNGRRRDWCGVRSLSDTGGPMTGDPDQIDAELKAQGYR